MKNKFYLLFLIFLFCITAKFDLNAVGPRTKEEIIAKLKIKQSRNTFVGFNYVNEDLSKIVNDIATIKCLNVVPLQPPLKIASKVTFTKYEEITLEEAWNILTILLDMAGYTLIQKANFYQIVKNENVIREPLPIYVDSLENIPDNDEKIKYIYFLNNISIGPNTQGAANLDQILKDMMPTEADGGTYTLDSTSNSIIIVNRASVIKGVMRIIQELDKTGFREALEVIPLKNTKADFITKIITQILPSEQEQQQFRYNPFGQRLPKGGSYFFSEGTKIIPLDRTNAVAIFGQPESVTRIKDFIIKNLDLPLQSEKSVIHVKTLQYLNSDDFAPVVQELVKAKSTEAQGQAEGTQSDTLSTAIIVSEKQTQFQAVQSTAPATSTRATTTPTTSAPVYGGNRLIVAARQTDWLIINKLIDELDKPQMQVALEVLVIDFAMNIDRAIGAQLRNRLNGSSTADASYVNFQSAHLHQPIINFVTESGVTTPTIFGLAANLATPFTVNSTLQNISSLETPGSTVLNFTNGNGVSAVLSVLENNGSKTILSQPYIITTNNQQANIVIQRKVLVQSNVVQQATGPAIIKNDYLKAALTVNILPRISSTDNINLEILVDVNDFASATETNAVITTRQIKTNANLKNKEILVLGGLPKITVQDEIFETPILAKIPIIGNLFKSKTVGSVKQNLMIFISPTIIKPRIQGGTNQYTDKKFDFIKNELIEDQVDIWGSTFDKLRDPISRVFFPSFAKEEDKNIEFYKTQGIFTEVKKQEQEIKQMADKKDEQKKAIEVKKSNEPAKATEIKKVAIADVKKADVTKEAPKIKEVAQAEVKKAEEIKNIDQAEQLKKIVQNEPNPLIKKN